MNENKEKTAGNLANSVVEGQGHIRRPAEKEMLLR